MNIRVSTVAYSGKTMRAGNSILAHVATSISV